MKIGFYPKLAFSGIVKNKKTYFPYILTCMGMVMMYYIIHFLSANQNVAGIRGGALMQEILSLGIGVIAVFAVVFLFYTNSFLIKNRKREFGLYNILGMGKRSLMRVLMWESLIIFLASITGGLACGILFSKAAELAMVHMLGGKAAFTFTIGPKAITASVILFAGIFLLILCSAMWQIHLAKPVELLKGGQVGEKPPKANFVLALIGLAILGGAYYIALTIQNPLDALVLFFVAVIMVIIATYMLFISGSVALCRLLQKSKRYYYKTNHFISVSSLSYRMKRNGAGLASICILSTIVLVMFSATACMWAGSEESLNSRYPRDIVIDTQTIEPAYLDEVDNAVGQVLQAQHAEQKRVLRYRYLNVTGYVDRDHVIFDEAKLTSFQLNTFANVRQMMFVPLEDYNRVMQTSEVLEKDEVILCSVRTDYTYAGMEIDGLGQMRVKKVVDQFAPNGSAAMVTIPTTYVFVQDTALIEQLNAYQLSVYGENASKMHDYYGFDLNGADQDKIEIEKALRTAFKELSLSQPQAPHSSIECLATKKDDYYGMNGGIFFLAILLGIVFIVGTVLIMYYKQVTEGYEDQDKFTILKKVGMRRHEIKKSIHSQMLTVFFLPLLTAGVHTAFAFPMVKQLLMLFQLNNTKLFLVVTLISFLVFAVFYTLVYALTSRVYYGIVSGSAEKDFK